MTDGGAVMRQPATSGSSRFGFGASALLLGLSLLLAACSSSGSDKSYPNLSSVPDQGPRPRSESLQEELIEGLIADHANAQYSGENLTATSAPAAEGEERVEITWEMARVLPAAGAEVAAAA